MKNRNWKRATRYLAALLCQILVTTSILAQQPAAQSDIRIIVLEGSGARNVVQQIPPRPFVVRVEDRERRPIFNAPVVFEAPQSGPGGEFANDSSSITVFTDPNGVATTGGFHPNAVPGTYQIQIRVEYQGQTATAAIAQTNITKRNVSKKLIGILGAVGAAGAVVALSRGSSEKTPPVSAPSITFGGSAVGAPKQ